MAKIDVTKIEGYDKMTPEQKLAALEAFEYEDNSAELERQKVALSKSNSEAAEWKRKHNALLSEEDKKKQETAEHLEELEKELNELRKSKTVADYTAKFVAQGYKEDLAKETAQALADGNTEKVFANQQKFLDDYAKSVKADAMKKTPRLKSVGDGDETMDYKKKIEEAQADGNMSALAYYTRLQAEAERTDSE